MKPVEAPSRASGAKPIPDDKGEMKNPPKPINATPVEDTKFGQTVLDGAHFLNEGYKSRQNVSTMESYRKDISDAMSKASDHDLQTVIEVAKANRGRQYSKRKNYEGKAIVSDKWQAWEDIRTLAEKELAKRSAAKPVEPVETASRASDTKPAKTERPQAYLDWLKGGGMKDTDKNFSDWQKRQAAKRSKDAIEEGRRNLAASPNAKAGNGKTIYAPKDGSKPFSVGRKAFTHGIRGANKADNELVGRHIGEVLDGSKALPERSGDARFRMAKVEIGGETAHVLFTITDKGELESVDVLKGLNTKREPAGTRSDVASKGNEAASSLRVVDDSIANFDAVWQERFKPGIEEHNKRVGRETKWTRDEAKPAEASKR
ncbi:MAG: hypothetical protein J6T01_00005, partial [Kiritimatiellae bacterium]|nr:hypothetical protein [Kiritimatiellia bacterium]